MWVLHLREGIGWYDIYLMLAQDLIWLFFKIYFDSHCADYRRVDCSSEIKKRLVIEDIVCSILYFIDKWTFFGALTMLRWLILQGGSELYIPLYLQRGLGDKSLTQRKWKEYKTLCFQQLSRGNELSSCICWGISLAFILNSKTTFTSMCIIVQIQLLAVMLGMG